MRQCRQVGHEECELSHLSMHRTWKPWWHLGRTRTRSPDENSDRHITHSVSNPESEATKFEHLRAHLMIEFNPSEHIKAHRRTERTITTFVSKVLSPAYISDGSWPFRLAGEVAVAVAAGDW